MGITNWEEEEQARGTTKGLMFFVFTFKVAAALCETFLSFP